MYLSEKLEIVDVIAKFSQDLLTINSHNISPGFPVPNLFFKAQPVLMGLKQKNKKNSELINKSNSTKPS